MESWLPRCHVRRPIVGMVHLLALPGSPRAASMTAVLRRARGDLETWLAAGADALLVENWGDRPFYGEQVPAVTIAAMTRVLASLRSRTRAPLGINVLRNDARAALSIAAVCDLDFVRVNVHAGVVVTDQGLLTGRAQETIRLREVLPGRPLVLADHRVKHGRSLGATDPCVEAGELLERAGADALLVTGPATGTPPDLEEWRTLRESRPDARMLIASGVTPQIVSATRREADGWIVGTWAKAGGRTEARPSRSRIARLRAARDEG